MNNLEPMTKDELIKKVSLLEKQLEEVEERLHSQDCNCSCPCGRAKGENWVCERCGLANVPLRLWKL